MEQSLIIIRHAESAANIAPHLIGGRCNESELSERGLRQAEQLGKYLSSHIALPQTVYCSPAVRTRQTAQIALRHYETQPAIQLDDTLLELSQGEWEGQDRKATYTPDVVRERTALGLDFKAPGGESMREVGQRMLQWANQTVVGSDDERAVVFGHGLAIRCLAGLLEGWDNNRIYGDPTGNASLSQFTHHDGVWRVDYIGKEVVTL